jgi:Ca-activated chloride channel family protein
VNGVAKKLSYDVRFPGESSDHEFIPRLWATRRVGFLLDEIRLHGENKELKDEVTDLARKYGIVTPYTAYLIYEDETRRGVATTIQSLPQLREDRAAYSVAGLAFESLSREKAGDVAVAGARAGLALRQAENAGGGTGVAPEQNALFMRRYGMAPAAGGAPATAGVAADISAAERVTQYTQQQRFVNGRNFFQNANQWVDSEVQKQQNARRVRVQFGSPEYFELARRQPQARQWLALGQNVQFVLEGTVYEIYDDSKTNG